MKYPNDLNPDLVELVHALAHAQARRDFLTERGREVTPSKRRRRRIDPSRDMRLSKTRFYINPDLSTARYVYDQCG